MSGLEYYQVNVDEEEIVQEFAAKTLSIFVAFKNGQNVNEVAMADPAQVQEMLVSLASQIFDNHISV
ncbi:hypothetical protein N7467_004141 [Penicillium canescens]|nr:hypothetical protein N7467_004141 [Penicillium canescens]